jgi:hypothetical protein
MNITENILLEKGFEKYSDNPYECYKIKAPLKGNKEYLFTLTIDEGYTNYPNREWNIQVDDARMCSVCGCDIQTTEQFNKLMDLLEIDFIL